jgi:hypothetical protein
MNLPNFFKTSGKSAEPVSKFSKIPVNFFENYWKYFRTFSQMSGDSHKLFQKFSMIVPDFCNAGIAAGR